MLKYKHSKISFLLHKYPVLDYSIKKANQLKIHRLNEFPMLTHMIPLRLPKQFSGYHKIRVLCTAWITRIYLTQKTARVLTREKHSKRIMKAMKLNHNKLSDLSQFIPINTFRFHDPSSESVNFFLVILFPYPEMFVDGHISEIRCQLNCSHQELIGVKSMVQMVRGQLKKNCYASVAFKTSIFYELKPWKTIMMSKHLKGNIMLHRGHSGTNVGLFHVCP